MRIAAKDLSGAYLNLAVAKARGLSARYEDGIVWLCDARGEIRRNFNPDSNWGFGGPIIARYGIEFTRTKSGWCAAMDYGNFDTGAMQRSEGEGPDHLVAAMRCVVAAEIGEVVDFGDILMGTWCLR